LSRKAARFTQKSNLLIIKRWLIKKNDALALLKNMIE